jgi:iron(III) transport system substrate-binding protein
MAPAGAQAEWDRLVVAAKQEGTVVLAGPTSQDFRSVVTRAFEARFGIPLEYLALPGSEAGARIMREGDAGKVTVDVMMGGGGELLSLYPAGRLDPIKPVLAMPEVVDMSKWRDAQLKWMDPEGQYLLQTCENVPAILVVNPDIVKSGAITSWKDLLKPEYKGKIAAYDPRSEGTGLGTATYLHVQLGGAFIRQLYIDQEVTFTRDERQLTEWVGRGTYPIGIGLVPRQIEPLRELGLKFERPFPVDAPGYLSGGFSVLKLIKNRPHTNGGIVLANWLASQEGQELYAFRAAQDVSRRLDVPPGGAPSYMVPNPSLSYLDTYTGSFYTTSRQKVQAEVQSILGK